MQAEEIFQTIQDDLQAIDDQIRNHPYLEALERKEVSAEALRSVPGHQFHIIISNIRADAHLLKRFGGTKFRDYFFGVLQSRMAAYPVLLTMASKLGMEQADLEHFEVDPDGFAYACYVSWLADNGSPGEIICGFGVNFPAWGANCRRVGAALRRQYDFSSDETQFFDSFHDAAALDTEAILEAIRFDLARDIPPERIHRAARLIQAYELRHWDAMARAADID